MIRNLGIGSWIARRARMTPHRVALVTGARRWTYVELDERITCLARALLALGIGSGDRVAFLGGNHPAALETLFACGLIGAIAVPMHPGFDDGSLRQILADAEPGVLIVTPEHVATLERHAASRSVRALVVIDSVYHPGTLRYEDLLAGASAEPVDRPIDLTAPCLLAFSSGTTGRHKGVVLTHGNVLFNALNVLSCADFVSDDVILSSAPLYRMGGLGFTLPVLFKGGTSVVVDRPDAEHALALIARHRVSIVFDSPLALDAMARSDAFARTDLSSLRIVTTGGSHVPRPLIDRYRERGILLRQGYGLTEAAPLALLLDAEDVLTHPGAAGRPPLYGAVRVVDAALEDVPPGTLGELLYHGPNVMQGYWRNPGATARALVDGGWLRTGDAAIMDADGVVTIAGRVSDVLEYSGRRIDPGAIEDHVRVRVGAECALVQAAPGATVVAFVVAGDADPLDVRARVAAICERHLPGHVEVRTLAALPRNVNGKVLRGVLRAWLASPAPAAEPADDMRASS